MVGENELSSPTQEKKIPDLTSMDHCLNSDTFTNIEKIKLNMMMVLMCLLQAWWLINYIL